MNIKIYSIIQRTALKISTYERGSLKKYISARANLCAKAQALDASLTSVHESVFLSLLRHFQGRLPQMGTSALLQPAGL